MSRTTIIIVGAIGAASAISAAALFWLDQAPTPAPQRSAVACVPRPAPAPAQTPIATTSWPDLVAAPAKSRATSRLTPPAPTTRLLPGPRFDPFDRDR